MIALIYFAVNATGRIMINNHKCFIVLTSKRNNTRFPDKNISDCAGKPLYRWAVDACLRADYIDRIYHISDDERMKGYLERLGIANIHEPDELCAPHVPILSVLKHTLNFIPAEDDDFIIWVDISKPLTRAWHINEVIGTAGAGGWDSVFTVKRLRYNLIGDAAVVSQLKPEKETRYIYFGAVRLRTARTLRDAEDGTWGTGANHLDLPICEDFEIDVDYPHDLIMADALLKAGY